jgi:response regulator RpfG family c-di-GMP phosphodiesterase
MSMTAQELAGDSLATRPRILCVDDEPHVLDGLRDMLRRSFDVKVATSGPVGLELLRKDPGGFSVVISDMRMPGMSGSDFLRQARIVAPDAVRMLLTGHADLEAAIRAVNGARLFRFLTKPCESGELLRACAAALGQHRLQGAERMLLEQTLRGTMDALAEVLAITSPAAFGRGRRVKALASELAQAVALPNAWEVEIAAMLAHIGAVTLPHATAEKLYAGLPLNDEERRMVQRVPAVTKHLLSKIPRLEGVVEILDTYRGPQTDDGRRATSEVSDGARILRIAVDYDELESQGASAEVGLATMRSRTIYDRRLMFAFVGLIDLGARASTVREVLLADLRVGMALADDVRGSSGHLLVARGQRVTDQLIERLANLDARMVKEPLRVFADEAGH